MLYRDVADRRLKGTGLANNVTSLTQCQARQASHEMIFKNSSAVTATVGRTEEGVIERFFGGRREGLEKLEIWLGF